MPKATILCGSAKPDGVTMAMCEAAREHLEEMGYRTVVVVLSDLEIGHCTDCNGCRGSGCVIDDEMSILYEAFGTSDIWIMATPIHFSGPSSLMKTSMDRFQPWWYDKTLPHPSRSLGLMCGGSDEPLFRNTVSIFRAFSITTGMEWMGHLEVTSTDRNGPTGVREKVFGFLDSVITDRTGI